MGPFNGKAVDVRILKFGNYITEEQAISILVGKEYQAQTIQLNPILTKSTTTQKISTMWTMVTYYYFMYILQYVREWRRTPRCGRACFLAEAILHK